MSDITDRLAEITTAIRTTVAASTLPNKTKITVSNKGSDILTAASQAAGGIILEPFPDIEWVAPRIRRVTWSIVIIAAGDPIPAADRCHALIDLVEAAGAVAWRAGESQARSSVFPLGPDETSPRIPGYTITVTEEHQIRKALA